MNLLIRNLAWLQRFDRIKIYYDSGQAIVNKANSRSRGICNRKRSHILQKKLAERLPTCTNR